MSEVVVSIPKSLESDKAGIETNVRLVPLKEFEDFVEKVKALSSDTDDLQYLALTLKLNLPVWSNDKELKRQSVIKVLSTGDLVEILSGSSL